MGFKAPEKFVVGEVVECYRSYRGSEKCRREQKVTVIAVNGPTVTVKDVKGLVLNFTARPSDGRHVAPRPTNAPYHPDMIYHTLTTAPTKRSR